MIARETFYTVTNDQKVDYFVNGTNAVVTVPNVDGMKWVATGIDGNKIEGVKGETSTTVTINAIGQAYTLNQEPTVVNVAQVIKADGTTTGYADLEAAVKAATKGDTVELLRDVELNEKKSLTLGSLTLDLKGHSIMNTVQDAKTLLEIQGFATVTIKDSVGGGKIIGRKSAEAVTGSGGITAILPLKDSKLIIESGEIIGIEAPSISGAHDVSAINNLGRLTISGGTVTAFKGQTATDTQISASVARQATSKYPF